MISKIELLPIRRLLARNADSLYRLRSIKQPVERESNHRMLIDADSPASSTVAASLL
jgi:hypothetical protein